MPSPSTAHLPWKFCPRAIFVGTSSGLDKCTAVAVSIVVLVKDWDLHVIIEACPGLSSFLLPEPRLPLVNITVKPVVLFMQNPPMPFFHVKVTPKIIVDQLYLNLGRRKRECRFVETSCSLHAQRKSKRLYTFGWVRLQENKNGQDAIFRRSSNGL